MSEIQQYYSNRENCFNDIRVAREAFGNKNTTEEQYDALQKSLGIMYLNCPEDIANLVRAQLYEAEQRRMYFGF